MNKKWTHLLLVPVLTLGTLLASPSHSEAANADAVVVKGVNFRSAPQTTAPVIRLLKTGESVDIISKVNNWWYEIIDQNGRTGYVSTSSTYLKVGTPAAATAPAVPVNPAPAAPAPTVQAPAAPAVPANPAPAAPAVSPNPAPAVASDAVQRVIQAGMKYMGTPYQFGASRSSTAAFDCSSFVRRAFLDGAGLKLPPDSRQQASYVKALGKTTTDLQQLKPGDLIFFMSYKGSQASNYAGLDKSAQRVTHVAIYLGNGKILHTYSKASGGVRISSIGNNAWEYRMIFGGSVL